MSSSTKFLSLSAAVILIFSAAPSRSMAQAEAPTNHSAAMTELFRYESTGLSILRPHERGKVPVVLIHGLWSNPWSWNRMIEALDADPAIKGQFQFWTFGYSTGDPIPYSAYLLRKNLDEVRRKLDPDRSDPALDRMVFVGHSMGGLLTKMMASDATDRLWRVISDRPFGELRGERDDLDLFRHGLFFEARPEARRVVYVATPHHGSRLDRGALQHVGTRLVRVADPLMAAHRRLVLSNDPSFFREHFRKAIPTSVDELEWGSPILTGLSELSHPPGVKVHSIIAVRPDSPPGRRTDGLVAYESAHIPDAISEKMVSSGHLCQDHPDVIGEVRRILLEHVKP